MDPFRLNSLVQPLHFIPAFRILDVVIVDLNVAARFGSLSEEDLVVEILVLFGVRFEGCKPANGRVGRIVGLSNRPSLELVVNVDAVVGFYHDVNVQANDAVLLQRDPIAAGPAHDPVELGTVDFTAMLDADDAPGTGQNGSFRVEVDRKHKVRFQADRLGGGG